MKMLKKVMGCICLVGLSAVPAACSMNNYDSDMKQTIEQSVPWGDVGKQQDNDVLPFFIHCDDVEYGLRCGRKPIIIEGVQVWHETYDKRMTPLMQYYDTRNPLFDNHYFFKTKILG